MVSAAIIFLQTSCVIPQAIILYRGRHVLPPRFFSLGRYGVAFNAISVVWVLFLDIIYCIPTTVPITIEAMNYVSVVVVGLVGFVIILWFATKSKSFTGPKIDFEAVAKLRQEGLTGLIVTDGLNVQAETEQTVPMTRKE